MQLVDNDSLARTIEALTAAEIEGRKLSAREKKQAARWLARRHDDPYAYADMFAPTGMDFARPIRLYSGEKITTRAGKAHLLGEETSRALLWLDVSDPDIDEALIEANRYMAARLAAHEGLRPVSGFYCCATCSVSMWRNLAAGGLQDNEKRLADGMKHLKAARDGKGRWERFPFWYTVLALPELDLKAARDEARYAAVACERILKRSADDTMSRRRRLLAERLLANC